MLTSMDKNSMEKLAEASAAEAEAASAVWQAVQAASASPGEETSVSDDNSRAAETISEGSDIEADVRLHPRAVCTLLRCYYVLKLLNFYEWTVHAVLYTCFRGYT